MKRLVSLLIWASLSTGVASEGCFSNIVWPGLKVESNSGGWNAVGKGFLSIFTPDRLTSEHWQYLGKALRKANNDMNKTKDTENVDEKFAYTDGIGLMAGLVFLCFIAGLLCFLFNAAPWALCVFWCCFKKKCKPKASKKVTYTGIGCNSLAILTIFLSTLFLSASIGSLSTGVRNVGSAFNPLPDILEDIVGNFSEQAKCLVSSLTASIHEPIDDAAQEISLMFEPSLKAVRDIKFAEMTAKIDGFIKTSQGLSAELQTMEANPQLVPIVGALSATRQKIDDVKNVLSDNGPNFIKGKLAEVEEKQKEASDSMTKKGLIAQMSKYTDHIGDVTKLVNETIDGGLKTVKEVHSDIKKIIDDNLKKNADKIADLMDRYSAFGNLILIPCYLALLAAIWSTVQSVMLLLQKEAKSQQKFGPLIPLSVGLGLAWIPIVVSVAFMSIAGFSNTLCNTFFNDQSMEYVPNALSAFNLPKSFNFSSESEPVEMATALQECRAGKNLMHILKLGKELDEMMKTPDFDSDGTNTDFTGKINDLPDTTDWNKIADDINTIDAKRAAAKAQIDLLKIAMNTAGDPVKGVLGPTIDRMDKLVQAIADFQTECTAAVNTGKALNTVEIVQKLLEITPKLLDKAKNSILSEIMHIKDGVLTNVTTCGFAFDAIENVGQIICDQGTGGLFGIYSAIGLGVLSLISASAGIAMIWHSHRAAKAAQDQKKPGVEKDDKKMNDKKDKKDEKNKKKGDKGDEGKKLLKPAEAASPPGGDKSVTGATGGSTRQ